MIDLKRIIAAAVLVAASALPALADQDGMRRPPSFAQLDVDGDGVVSSEEFVGPPLEHFTELDVDGNGVVSSEEFIARPLERFTMLDTDGNGVLSQDELQAGHPGRRPGGPR